jgi:CRP-like cAMP-binding protein
MISELGSVFLFKELDLDALEEVAAFCNKLYLLEGEELISENNRDTHNDTRDLFVLLRGTVEITSNGSGVTSDEVSLSRQDKELFGEISWLYKGNRTATVRCLGDVEAIRIHGEQFMNYLTRRPEIGFQVMKKIAQLLAGRLTEADSLLKQILWNANI